MLLQDYIARMRTLLNLVHGLQIVYVFITVNLQTHILNLLGEKSIYKISHALIKMVTSITDFHIFILIMKCSKFIFCLGLKSSTKHNGAKEGGMSTSMLVKCFNMNIARSFFDIIYCGGIKEPMGKMIYSKILFAGCILAPLRGKSPYFLVGVDMVRL
jgi:hypothetical protein